MNDGQERLHELQARGRKLRAELEVLSAEIHAQIAENERLRPDLPDDDLLDDEQAV